MVTLLIMAGLCLLSLACTVTCLMLFLAWQRSRPALSGLALRLNAESEIEVATLQTLSEMREAARTYMRQQT